MYKIRMGIPEMQELWTNLEKKIKSSLEELLSEDRVIILVILVCVLMILKL